MLYTGLYGVRGEGRRQHSDAAASIFRSKLQHIHTVKSMGPTWMLQQFGCSQWLAILTWDLHFFFFVSSLFILDIYIHGLASC